MQIHRLFEIVYILLDKKQVTAKQLAEQFEVSMRTIYRDIDVLSGAGIPIYTSQGTGGGISIYEDYRLQSAILDEEEKNQILLGLKSIMSTEELQSSALLRKLKGAFQIPNTDWIEVDFSRWGCRKRDNQLFNEVKKTILSHRILKFRYMSSYGETKERTIYPMKLLYKGKGWYMQGYDKDVQAYRTFKITRFLSLEILPEHFDTTSLPDIPLIEEYIEEHYPLIKFRCASYLAYRLYDEFEPDDIKQQTDGSYIVEVEMPNDAWLHNYLLSFGSGVEVLEPQDIRERLKKEVLKIRNIYK